MAWTDTFLGKTTAQMLQEITEINDKLRDLRREVLAVDAANSKIEDSTRDYGTGWQGQLFDDMVEGDNGQDGIRGFAETLVGHFSA